MSLPTQDKSNEQIQNAQQVVFFTNEPIPESTPQCRGFNWDGEVSLDSLLSSFYTVGFQATNLGLAIDEINRMLNWRLSDIPIGPNDDDEVKDPEFRSKTKCKIFFAYTSNMISSGIRETIKFLVKNKLVDVLITSAGGIEEDFMKCLAPHYIGSFDLKGVELRKKGQNRIGNLLVSNNNYCIFEDWIMPILHQMADEQEKNGTIWSPSSMINRLGKEINNEDSVYYWAYKNNIPVFCPALTDGSIGDMLYFFNYKRPEFVLDLVQDIRKLNDQAIKSYCSGMVILGGGVVKHHCCNANLMRNGANYAVYINTGQEFDGSDAGAKPDEAISWGKIRIDANPVKVYSDATLVFPLIVSQTFAKYLQRQKEQEQQENQENESKSSTA